MLEIIGVAALLLIGWELGQVIRAIKGVETEMSTARWERGARSGCYRGPDGSEALDRESL